MEKNEAAEQLLGGGKTVFLVTAGDDRRFDARAMMVAASEGFSTVWMVTCKCSGKFVQLSKDPRCMVYATLADPTDDYLELRLWGSAELLDDPNSRRFAWREECRPFFPEGMDDPNLVVVKFTADSGVMRTTEGMENLVF